jgi:hypothetical protein
LLISNRFVLDFTGFLGVEARHVPRQDKSPTITRQDKTRAPHDQHKTRASQDIKRQEHSHTTIIRQDKTRLTRPITRQDSHKTTTRPDQTRPDQTRPDRHATFNRQGPRQDKTRARRR